MSMIETGAWGHDGEAMAALLQKLLLKAWEGLNDTRLGVPDQAVLSHDFPPEDCCNFLALWVRPWVPFVEGEFPNEPAPLTPGARCRQFEFFPRLTLTLRRPCAPDLKPDPSNPFPEPGEETAAAIDMIIDARALQCAVASTWPGIVGDTYVDAQMWPRQMSPTGGSTGCFGWDWEIDIETRGCKTTCWPTGSETLT
jgi:hypothetical protein